MKVHKQISPDIALKGFSCPHCGVLTDQTWFEVHADHVRTEDRLPFLAKIDFAQKLREDAKDLPPEIAAAHERLADRLEIEARGMPLLRARDKSAFCDFDVRNIHLSKCYTCGDITIWRYGTILYPPVRYEIEPNPDMAEDIRADFDEARALLDMSPRAAAALLRLCVQKLCKQIGEKGRSIDEDVKALVAKGLDPRIQKALDIVRVVGNHAVHPGTIDLKDDRATAAKLFELVNRIALDMITHPKEVAALYDEKLPDAAKEAINKRDRKASSET